MEVVFRSRVYQEIICQYLTFGEAVQLWEALKKQEIRGKISVGDRDNCVQFLSIVNSWTIPIAASIEKFGSNKTLLTAVHQKDYPAVKFLLEMGADPNGYHLIDLKTPLIESIDIGSYQLAKFLLEKGSKPNLSVNNNIPVIRAAFQKRVQMVKLLVSYGAELSDENLFQIFKENCTKIIEVLLEFDFNFDRDHYGYTPLILATINENTKVMELLLKKGVNVNTVNTRGFNVLMIAIGRADYSLVELICQYHPDFSIRNDQGQTALDIAIHSGNDKIERLLRSHGA